MKTRMPVLPVILAAFIALVSAGAPAAVQSAAFDKKYGIAVDYVIGKSAQIAAKWDTERRGGQNLADLNLPGMNTSSHNAF